jgi:acyl-CoA synthetase (NDP forming)
VAVVTNAASPAVLAMDALRASGLEAAELSSATRDTLAATLPAEATIGRAVDLTFRSTAAHYGVALQLALADDGVDALIAIYAPPIGGCLDDVATAVVDAAAPSGKPVVAVTLGRDDGPLQPGAPVPAFAFPEPAASALGRLVRYAAWRARPESAVPAFEDVDVDAAHAIVRHALDIRPGGTLLPLAATAELLATYGIPMAPARAVTSLDAAVAAAEKLGFPVALKAAGLERLARSESGGVALDIQDTDELRGSYVRMAASLGPAMAEAVVQRMVPGGVETIVTVEGHETFGPVVGFGLGGACADAIADRAVSSVPLSNL